MKRLVAVLAVLVVAAAVPAVASAGTNPGGGIMGVENNDGSGGQILSCGGNWGPKETPPDNSYVKSLNAFECTGGAVQVYVEDVLESYNSSNQTCGSVVNWSHYQGWNPNGAALTDSSSPSDVITTSEDRGLYCFVQEVYLYAGYGRKFTGLLSYFSWYTYPNEMVETSTPSVVCLGTFGVDC